MNEEHIVKVQALLTEWNPLGNRLSQIIDLNNNEIEATDILFHIKKNNTVDQISKIIGTVLNQAFGIHVKPAKCKKIAEQVQLMLKEK